eukprot:Gb_40311 [translate_table: standard]
MGVLYGWPSPVANCPIMDRKMGGDPVTTEPPVIKVDEESSIARESMPNPWDRVGIHVMKYLTLEGWERKGPTSPRVVKLLYQSVKENGGILGGLKGGFPRSSETPISRDQLHLGIVPLGKDSLSPTSKPSQKLEEKNKIVDYIDTSKEDKGKIDDDKDAEIGKGVEYYVPRNLPRRGRMLEPYMNFIVLEELRCHLKILNGLRGPLTSTYACINLLALEITNYLKEVVSKMKEMGFVESQVELARISKVNKKD